MPDMISRAAAIDYLMTNMGWRDEDGYEVELVNADGTPRIWEGI